MQILPNTRTRHPGWIWPSLKWDLELKAVNREALTKRGLQRIVWDCWVAETIKSACLISISVTSSGWDGNGHLVLECRDGARGQNFTWPNVHFFQSPYYLHILLLQTLLWSGKAEPQFTWHGMYTSEHAEGEFGSFLWRTRTVQKTRSRIAHAKSQFLHNLCVLYRMQSLLNVYNRKVGPEGTIWTFLHVFTMHVTIHYTHWYACIYW